MILLLRLHSLDCISDAPILIRLFPHLPLQFLLHSSHSLSDVSNLLVHSLLTCPDHLVNPSIKINLREPESHLGADPLLHQVQLLGDVLLDPVVQELEGVRVVVRVQQILLLEGRRVIHVELRLLVHRRCQGVVVQDL